MKNTLKIFGIVILTAAVILSMSTCDEDDSGGSSAFLGKTLKLSGQVWDFRPGNVSEKFTGTATVTAYSYDEETEEYVALGATGIITGGQLSIEIGTPTYLVSGHLEDFFYDVKVSDKNVKAATLLTLKTTDGSLWLYRFTYSAQSHHLNEQVRYIYVDRDVTITRKGETFTTTCNCEEYDGTCNCSTCDCGGTKVTIKNLNLNLKTGWNAFTIKTVYSNAREETSCIEGVGATRWFIGYFDHYDDD